MKYPILNISLFVLFAMACSSSKSYPNAENNLDCFKKFINASLQGDIERADHYLLKDSLNLTLLNDWHQKYIKLPKEEQEKFASSSIVILKDSAINDSVSLISYYNSYKKLPTQIKIYHIDHQYLVDIKHTFYGNQ